MDKAIVYQQAYDSEIAEVEVRNEDLDLGFIWIPCSDCNGSGGFSMPDDEVVACVRCKTSGLLPVSVL